MPFLIDQKNKVSYVYSFSCKSEISESKKMENLKVLRFNKNAQLKSYNLEVFMESGSFL